MQIPSFHSFSPVNPKGLFKEPIAASVALSAHGVDTFVPLKFGNATPLSMQAAKSAMEIANTNFNRNLLVKTADQMMGKNNILVLPGAWGLASFRLNAMSSEPGKVVSDPQLASKLGIALNQSLPDRRLEYAGKLGIPTSVQVSESQEEQIVVSDPKHLEALNKANGAITQEWLAVLQKAGGGMVSKQAFFHTDDLRPHPEFLKRLNDGQVNVHIGTFPKGDRRPVDQWVKHQVGVFAPDMPKEQPLTAEQLAIVNLNTILLTAPWQYPFSPLFTNRVKPEQETFHGLTEDVKPDMMTIDPNLTGQDLRLVADFREGANREFKKALPEIRKTYLEHVAYNDKWGGVAFSLGFGKNRAPSDLRYTILMPTESFANKNKGERRKTYEEFYRSLFMPINDSGKLRVEAVLNSLGFDDNGKLKNDTHLHLTMPKSKTEGYVNLSKAFEAMGLSEMFDEAVAERLDRTISEQRSGLEVDELGIKLGSVSAAQVYWNIDETPHQEVTVDRPYIGIVHTVAKKGTPAKILSVNTVTDLTNRANTNPLPPFDKDYLTAYSEWWEGSEFSPRGQDPFSAKTFLEHLERTGRIKPMSDPHAQDIEETAAVVAAPSVPATPLPTPTPVRATEAPTPTPTPVVSTPREVRPSVPQPAVEKLANGFVKTTNLEELARRVNGQLILHRDNDGLHLKKAAIDMEYAFTLLPDEGQRAAFLVKVLDEAKTNKRFSAFVGLAKLALYSKFSPESGEQIRKEIAQTLVEQFQSYNAFLVQNQENLEFGDDSAPGAFQGMVAAAALIYGIPVNSALAEFLPEERFKKPLSLSVSPPLKAMITKNQEGWLGEMWEQEYPMGMSRFLGTLYALFEKYGVAQTTETLNI